MDGAGLREIIHILTPMAVPASPRPASERHPGLERKLLTIQLTTTNARRCRPLSRRSAPAGPVPKALGGLDAGHRTDPDPGLVQPETTRPRPDLRRG